MKKGLLLLAGVAKERTLYLTNGEVCYASVRLIKGLLN